MANTSPDQSMFMAIAWCLAWGDQLTPRPEHEALRKTLRKGQIKQSKLPQESQTLLKRVRSLQAIGETTLISNYPRTLEQLQAQYPDLFEEETAIGLVLGGATKIKQYVFESVDLQEIRGASALLDRINLTDLKAFFDPKISSTVRSYKWFQDSYGDLTNALIPQLIIYSTGGNILAFCPAAYVHQLADAIEQCYTRETLIANSAAVGDTFKLPELRFGRLRRPWLEDYLNNPEHEIFKSYFDQPRLKDASPLTEVDYVRQFCDRKNFNELVAHLATRFNQRRSGNSLPGRNQTRACPPMLETHAYLTRDESGHRSSTVRIKELPSNPRFSEASARKYVMGQKSKRDSQQDWWQKAIGDWQPGDIKSWVQKFLDALPHLTNHSYDEALPQGVALNQVKEARSLRAIGAASNPKGFVAYIYADGNNMGGYIQKAIKTPEAYQQFSEDVSHATEYAVYRAIAHHLTPSKYEPDARDSYTKSGWIHPFEILTIGGDDVLLIVPGDKGLAIAKTISEEFEQELLRRNQTYRVTQTYEPNQVHRYRHSETSERPTGKEAQCHLSMSAGVLMTADNTPIFYADRLVSQLLKSAKRKAKTLKKEGYLGGTVDFLVLKSVTMISSKVDEFRAQGLTIDRPDQPTLKLYGAPYTLHELGGLLDTVQQLRNSKFPVSQIYQIRSLLEQGKKTAMLNYRYFRARLQEKADILDTHFDNAWCWAQSNDGSLAPWRYVGDRTYETIWRELVDLYDFVSETHMKKTSKKNKQSLSTRRKQSVKPL